MTQAETWPIPVPVQTQRWTPRVVIFILFSFATWFTFRNLGELALLTPPENPLVSSFLLGSGRHYWLIEGEGKSLAAVVGGWTKGKEHQYLRYRFFLEGGEEVLVSGKFSQYRALIAAHVKTPKGEFQFDGARWSPPVTREPIMLLDTIDGRKFLKLPDHLARDVEKLLRTVIPEQSALRQVSERKFRRGLRQMRAKSGLNGTRRQSTARARMSEGGIILISDLSLAQRNWIHQSS